MVTSGARQGHRMLAVPNAEVGTWLGPESPRPGLDASLIDCLNGEGGGRRLRTPAKSIRETVGVKTVGCEWLCYVCEPAFC